MIMNKVITGIRAELCSGIRKLKPVAINAHIIEKSDNNKRNLESHLVYD